MSCKFFKITAIHLILNYVNLIKIIIFLSLDKAQQVAHWSLLDAKMLCVYYPHRPLLFCELNQILYSTIAQSQRQYFQHQMQHGENLALFFSRNFAIALSEFVASSNSILLSPT